MHETMKRVYEAFDAHPDYNPWKRQSSLGKILGESNQAVKNWESRGVSKNAINKIVKDFHINPEWIKTGNGDKFLGKRPSLCRQSVVIEPCPVVNIKDTVRYLGHGRPDDLVSGEMICPVLHSPETFGLVLHTDHFGYRPNEVIFIDPRQTPEVGDDALIAVMEGDGYNVIRKTCENELGQKTFWALSDTTLPQVVNERVAHVIGRVICAVREA